MSAKKYFQLIIIFFGQDDKIFQLCVRLTMSESQYARGKQFWATAREEDHNQQLYGEVARRDYFASLSEWAVGAAIVRLSLAQVEHSEVPPPYSISNIFFTFSSSAHSVFQRITTGEDVFIRVCFVCRTKRSFEQDELSSIGKEPIHREDNMESWCCVDVAGRVLRPKDNKVPTFGNKHHTTLWKVRTHKTSKQTFVLHNNFERKVYRQRRDTFAFFVKAIWVFRAKACKQYEQYINFANRLRNKHALKLKQFILQINKTISAWSYRRILFQVSDPGILP